MIFVKVNYSATKWLMKNMDPSNENIVQYLQASQDPFVCHIWKDGKQVNKILLEHPFWFWEFY